MADSPATSGTSFEDHKTGYLPTSLDIPRDNTTRPRSTSVSSARSTVTFIENNSDVPVLDTDKIQKIKQSQRRRTHIAEVKLSWWQCLKGVFLGPQATERAARKSIVPPEMEEEEEDDVATWWILNVHAIPRPKSGIEEHQEARCTFDTGCLQGNIISKEFALRLGYTESDFKPLRSRERNGGTSATGHPHTPLGVLYISWYHNSSPRLYSGMRFLVSADANCQLIIGARSIQKHRLLSAPILSVEEDRRGITVFPLGSDKGLDNLRSEQAKLENQLATDRRAKRFAEREAGKEKEVKKLASAIKHNEKKLRIKKLEIELYSAKKDLAADPNNQKIKAVIKNIEEDIEEERVKNKSERSSVSLKAPTVNVSEPNGHTRSPTGLSSVRSGGRSRAK